MKDGKMLCCPLESVYTMQCKTHSEQEVHSGEMIQVNDTIGIVLEDTGPNADFILIYQAEKIYVPMNPGEECLLKTGDTAYYDPYQNRVSQRRFSGRDLDNIPCGKVLADANPGDEVVLIHLMVMK